MKLIERLAATQRARSRLISARTRFACTRLGAASLGWKAEARTRPWMVVGVAAFIGCLLGWDSSDHPSRLGHSLKTMAASAWPWLLRWLA